MQRSEVRGRGTAKRTGSFGIVSFLAPILACAGAVPPASGSDLVVFGVDDVGATNSQLFVLNITTGDLSLRGPVHQDTDLEGMTFFNGDVVGVTGETGGPHNLATVDFDLGTITLGASIDFGPGPDTEVRGMASDGSGVHWAFLKSRGFAIITDAPSFSLEIPFTLDIHGLAVSIDGNTLYAMHRDGRIFQVDVPTGNISLLVDIGGLFEDDKIENLELLTENELAFFTHDDDDDSGADVPFSVSNNLALSRELTFSVLNILTRQITFTAVFEDTGLRDLETFVFAAPEELTGACCLDDGTCVPDQTAEECAAIGGRFQGEGSDCSVPCDVLLGACCLTDGTCVPGVLEEACAAAGGIFQGGGSDCSIPCPQPTGACCLDDGTCLPDRTAAECAAAGGTFRGVGSDCLAGCQPACCLVGVCLPLNEVDCNAVGGVFQGIGIDCAGFPCPLTGACCLDDGTCVPDVTAEACAAKGGRFQGVGSDCSVPCDVLLGACCLTDGTCVPGVLEEACAAAGGIFQGGGSDCSIPCPLPPTDFCVRTGPGPIKPQVLTMQYTGDGCDATSHSQSPSNVSCSGDPGFASKVRILASDKRNPGHRRASVWFDGMVQLNQQFDIDATLAGKTRLKGTTFVHVFDLSGNLLQAVKFHTSCSEPLNAGDQFGSLQLINVVLERR